MMDVHRYRLPILHENLAEERPLGLACFNVGVRHEEPFWSLGGLEPTRPQTVFFRGAKLNEDEARSRDLGFDATSKSLDKEKGIGCSGSMELERDIQLWCRKGLLECLVEDLSG